MPLSFETDGCPLSIIAAVPVDGACWVFRSSRIIGERGLLLPVLVGLGALLGEEEEWKDEDTSLLSASDSCVESPALARSKMASKSEASNGSYWGIINKSVPVRVQ